MAWGSVTNDPNANSVGVNYISENFHLCVLCKSGVSRTFQTSPKANEGEKFHLKYRLTDVHGVHTHLVSGCGVPNDLGRDTNTVGWQSTGHGAKSTPFKTRSKARKITPLRGVRGAR